MRLLLVDGHYYLYRSFFAIRGLTNSKGEPTNAIYGFLKAVRKMLVDVKPDLAAVIWDAGLPERRVALQPAYKQNRPPMPDEMRSQEDWLQEKIEFLGLSSLSLPNTEADDIIAIYAQQAAAKGHEAVIATNDKDIFQIVTDKIRVYSSLKAAPGKESFALLGVEETRAKWGVEPHQIAEILALTGDSSDNIPGVPGVGEKTAAQLVRTHGTVGELLANTAAIPNPKLRDKIESAREQILSNRHMVDLDRDIQVPVPFEELTIKPRYDELIPALRECEFKGLLKEVEDEAAAKSPSQLPTQGELL
jgi:DNA polymerase-1